MPVSQLVTDDAAARTPPVRLRCRLIADADIDAVVALLAEGFPARTARQWRQGIDRHLTRPVLEGLPRLGYLLQAADRIVGVILTFYAVRTVAGRPELFCNLSSWYVLPAYSGYAVLLDQMAMRRKDVTYTNISAIRRTWPIHEARGFGRFCSGAFVAAPLLARPRAGARVQGVEGACRAPGLETGEAALLEDHARFGCVSLVATDGHGSEPLVFVRRPAESIRRRFGWSPLSFFHLIHCRPTFAWDRFAHALGRTLLARHAMPWIVVDAQGPIAGLPGRFVEGWGTKLARGPAAVRNGDLSYTEMVLFSD